MCVKELLQSRFLYEFHELERREVQCTLNFLYISESVRTCSFTEHQEYLFVYFTDWLLLFFNMLYLHPKTCPWVVFFWGFFHIELQKSNQKTAICAWKENFEVLLLRFQNKVLKDIVFQYLPVFLLTESLRYDGCSVVSHGQTCLLPLPFLT